MALSLLVLLVPLILGVGIYKVLYEGDKPVVVDPASALAEARSAGAFPVTEPSGLADSWRTVSAKFQREADGAVLRLGYLTPGGEGAQFVQSNVPADKLLPDELTDKAHAEGTTEVSGELWQRYQTRPGERALALLRPTYTIIVIGLTSESDLSTLARATSR